MPECTITPEVQANAQANKAHHQPRGYSRRDVPTFRYMHNARCHYGKPQAHDLEPPWNQRDEPDQQADRYADPEHVPAGKRAGNSPTVRWLRSSQHQQPTHDHKVPPPCEPGKETKPFPFGNGKSLARVTDPIQFRGRHSSPRDGE